MRNYFDQVKDTIGNGAIYPFTFTEEGGVKTDDARSNDLKVKSRINGSIHFILETLMGGDRYRRPDFGCRLKELVFEPNDEILKDLLDLYIRESIVKWEKRITVTSITFSYPSNDTSGHTILITVNYFINDIQSSGSYVYPFKKG